MIGNDTDEITKELFNSLLDRYQVALEQSIKGRNYMFGNVDGLHYICHKTSLNHDGSYIDSSK